MNKQQLLRLIRQCQGELDTAETVLNDGIDYGHDFAVELHEHVKSVMITACRVKGILVKRYGVVAI